MEKTSLFLISSALVLLGTWEVFTWPNWTLIDTALFTLFGQLVSKLYSLTELAFASLFAVFGMLGIYYVAISGSYGSHRFQFILIFLLLILYFSAVGFMIIGSELMANNRLISTLIGRLWQWKYHHAKYRSDLFKIEELYQCCGWSNSHQFALSSFCHEYPIMSISSCTPFLLNNSGKLMYRQGLLVLIYSFPLLILACLTIQSSQKSVFPAEDLEEAQFLNERRKQVYSGTAPPIQLQ